mmetsp:Transcript_5065/g.7337  ORF Transcript_5065/g.7337 Transcript_5065/m.7337 type:complete len:134 (+) Transcript_5065:36-437(+)
MDSIVDSQRTPGCSCLFFVAVAFFALNLLSFVASIIPFLWAWNTIFYKMKRIQPSVVTFAYEQSQKKMHLADSCPICLTDYDNGDIICHGKFCFHTFHTECLRGWMRKQPLCPCCRQNIFQINRPEKSCYFIS